MTSELVQEAMDCDRQLKASKTVAEMKAAISRRRLVRAEMDFVRAMDQLEAENPVPAIRESFTLIR